MCLRRLIFLCPERYCEMKNYDYRSLDDIYAAEPDMPAAGDTKILAKPVTIGKKTAKNAIAIQPMEGCDGTADGAPGEWTFRRYSRYAEGGAGLVWMEAISTVPEGRANPLQLMLTEKNVDVFKRLLDETREKSAALGEEPPLVIAQLTHSGRWSRPIDKAAPIRAWTSSVLDPHQKLPDDHPIATDEYLDALPERFAASTKLAREAGFDGVDVKACHLYLYSELLGAFGRPGRYGGSFENRVRLYLDSVDAAKSELGDMLLATRLNLYDGTAAGWGVGEDGEPDMTEPARLLGLLRAKGVELFNITMGTPYFNPHVNRPYNRGGYIPPEEALKGVARLLNGCAEAQKQISDAVCLATGFSYLREFAPYIAAGMAERGEAKLFGFGRAAFAYPELARDICEKGRIEHGKCCVTCSICTQIMRAGGRPGCPIHDTEQYLPEYNRVIRHGGVK